MRFNDKLLLQPQFLLELLNLNQKVDNLSGNHADNFDFREVLRNAQDGLIFYIIKLQDLVFNIEVQFTAEEGAKIFVNEKVKSVPSGISPEMCFQPTVVRLFSICHYMRFAQFRNPWR